MSDEGNLSNRPHSTEVIESLSSYGQYCIELAADLAEDPTRALEVPEWDEYLVEYLVEELAAALAEK